MAYLWVALGSACGGAARYWCSAAIAARTSATLPWGTIAVNIIGSLIIGIVYGLLEPTSRWQIATTTREFVNQFFMVGVLGGFTTFSSFSLQSLALMRSGEWAQAGVNVGVSVVLCLLAVSAGFWIATR
jgi:CrcB protein